MSGDIVITTGLTEPYVIPYTDPANEQVTRNLAIGKLALMASESGRILKKQSLTMQKVVDGLDFVSDILDRLQPPVVWTSKEPLNLNISDQIGLSPTSAKFNADRLIAATNLMLQNNVNFGGIDYYRFKSVNGTTLFFPASNFPILEVSDIKDIPTSASSPDSPLLVNVVNDGVITSRHYYFSGRLDNSGKYDYFPVNESEVSTFAIPETEKELFSWSSSHLFEEAISRTNNIFGDFDTVLYEDGDEETTITARILINYDAISVKDTTGNISYYKLSVVADENKLQQPADTVFYLSSDKEDKKKYYISKGNGVITELDSTTVFPFILQPKDSDIQSWRSQFSEKQILVSQKSSTLQNFLNELLLTYNLLFDATTNILRSFQNITGDIARNV